ncbi:putative uncharacterized protein [Pseudomonas sp. Os17]|uniref:hypothetical protein n=1 Tax=Pseudomonas sp. Os17 TaxID=1500686 RepID=UPI0005FC6B15|nr:hypothetical protein [Pseudomonas sp. Os17]BAQ75228.1 putative uncharacterized protein [Pseudomonas sp. Os17]
MSSPVERNEWVKIEKALLWLDDFVSRRNGDSRGSCSAIETLRAALECKPAAHNQGKPTLIQAVAVTCQNDDGMYLEWLLEGGISEREFSGQVLFAIPEATDLCDEDGGAEIYTRPVEQPASISSTSDKYEAELYDEGWQLARDMGLGNVTDALMQRQGKKSR